MPVSLAMHEELALVRSNAIVMLPLILQFS